MRKSKVLIFLLGVLLLVSSAALADQQTYELPSPESVNLNYGESWTNETYDLLVSGDTVHFLKWQYGSGKDCLDDEGMWMISVDGGECYALNEQGEIVPCPDHCGDVIATMETCPYGSFFGRVKTPQNETYLIDITGKVFHWTPGADSAWEHVLQLDMSGLKPIQSEEEWFYYAADEQGLYMIWPSAQEGNDLYAFDWTSGARRLLTHFGWVNNMAPAAPGKLLVSGNLRSHGYGDYFIVDSQTGEATELVDGLKAVYASGFLWNRMDGWYYTANTGSVQYLGMNKEESALTSFSGMPSDFGSCDIALSMDGQQLYILLEDARAQAYRFIVFDLQGTEKKLTINGETNLLNTQFGAISSMIGDSPELEGVQFDLRSDAIYANDVAQLLLTQDDTSDILVVNTARVDLRSLFAKGYFVPLDDQPEIQAYFDQLYPAWKDACMAQGSIAALPFYTYDQYQFMVNTELWEELGLDIPTSYHELFEVIHEMDRRGLLEEYPLFDINGIYARSFDHLLFKLLQDYLLSCDLSGGKISLIDPTLEQLLQELSELRDLLDRHDARRLAGSPLMIFDGFVTSVSLGQRMYENYGEYAPILLSMDETRGPILQTYVTVLLVNPYSKNVDLAKAWLAWLAANPTAQTRCVFLTGMPDGIEREESRTRFAEYEEKLADLEQQYAEAEASGDPEALEKVREAFASNVQPMHDWLVTPEYARMLYPALPYARVLHYNPHILLLDNGEKPIQEFQSGKRNAHDLLQALETLAMMINEEGM